MVSIRLFPKGITIINLESYEPVIARDIVKLSYFNDLLTLIRVYEFEEVFKCDDTYYIVTGEILYIFSDK